jgi:hypothetical protein
MNTFTIFKNPSLVKLIGNELILVRNGDVTYSVSKTEENIHYQEYLKWLAAGNTPEPADE